MRRRCFLGRAVGIGLTPLVGTGCGDAIRREAAFLASAYGDDEPGLVSFFPDSGRTVLIRTSFRGHDVASHPRRPTELVLFGRRPATESAVVDVESGRILRRLVSGPGCAFQGHGFFTPDGSWLVTSEAKLDSADGRLGIWRTDTYQRVDAFETAGVGPHEIALLPDHRTIVVANGGLLTRPETGSEVLNLDTMDSSLTYIDLSRGETVDQYRVAEPKASLRHLDVDIDGRVVFGAQIQRAALDHQRPLPLAGVHRRGEAPRMFALGMEVFAAMNDYVGSVALSSALDVAAFSSPRGDLCAFWRIDDGELVGYHRLVDGCGLSASLDGQRFVLSSSTGEVRTLGPDGREFVGDRRRLASVRWDNHLLVVPNGPDQPPEANS